MPFESGVTYSKETDPELIDEFMAAVRKRESEGRGGYAAKGKWTGETYGQGLGAYQIMSKLWPHFAKEAGLEGADWRDKKAQDAVARFKFKQYFSRYGAWDAVAVAWFAGPGRAAKFVEGKDLSGIRDANGVDTPEYAQQVLGYMGEYQPRSETSPKADPSEQALLERGGSAGAGVDPIAMDQLPSKPASTQSILASLFESVAKVNAPLRADYRTLGRGFMGRRTADKSQGQPREKRSGI